VPDDRGLVLLSIARASLAEALGLDRLRSYDDPWLLEPGATFVTLRHRRQGGRLRGCVGSLHAHRPLFDDVRANARAAAFHDTRFAPVSREELPDLSFEVSLLSSPEPFDVSCEEEALARLRPGVDGLIFDCEGCRSTFLPQVWDHLREPREFLTQLKLKAGLPAVFWSPGVRLWRYTVSKWAEGEE
jgi:AmmeMemoRadiSam system protein A